MTACSKCEIVYIDEESFAPSELKRGEDKKKICKQCKKEYRQIWGRAKRKVKKGTMYIVSNPAWPGWVKVGKTVDLTHRMRTYHTGCPFDDYVIDFSMSVDDLLEAEETILADLRSSKLTNKGEWFECEAKHAMEFLLTYHGSSR